MFYTANIDSPLIRAAFLGRHRCRLPLSPTCHELRRSPNRRLMIFPFTSAPRTSLLATRLPSQNSWENPLQAWQKVLIYSSMGSTKIRPRPKAARRAGVVNGSVAAIQVLDEPPGHLLSVDDHTVSPSQGVRPCFFGSKPIVPAPGQHDYGPTRLRRAQKQEP